MFSKLNLTHIAILWALVVLLVSQIATPHMTAATVAYGFLLMGIAVRKQNRRLHAGLMTSGILLDLAVVLILEVQRNAINTATQFSMTPLQQAHIFTSSIAVLFYIPAIVLGALRLKGKYGPKVRTWHLRTGGVAFVFRTLGFLLMFSLLEYYRRKAGL